MKKLLLLTLLTASSAYGNPVISAGVTNAGTVSLNSVTNWAKQSVTSHSISFNVAGNGAYLVFACGIGGSATISDVTWNGVSMTLITNAALSSGFGGKVHLRGLSNPSAGTQTLTVTTSTTDTDLSCSLSLWNNINATPYSGLNVNESAGGNPASSPSALTVTSTSGNIVFSAFNLYNATPTGATAPQTLLCLTNIGTSSLAVSYTNATGSAISCPYTYTGSQYWIEAGISLKP